MKNLSFMQVKYQLLVVLVVEVLGMFRYILLVKRTYNKKKKKKKNGFVGAVVGGGRVG